MKFLRELIANELVVVSLHRVDIAKPKYSNSSVGQKDSHTIDKKNIMKCKIIQLNYRHEKHTHADSDCQHRTRQN